MEELQEENMNKIFDVGGANQYCLELKRNFKKMNPKGRDENSKER